MTYVPPFNVVRRRLFIHTVDGRGRVNISYQEFLDFIKLMLRGVAVDERWYLNEYPDVAEAIRSGAYKSAKHHFVEEGYFEGRKPAEAVVDADWYVENNQDVAEGIKSGQIASAQEHFLMHGYGEGRLPSKY
ncbi:MAG: hypothetical protein U1F33_08345 [Alphaproteobacteria bacterium]